MRSRSMLNKKTDPENKLLVNTVMLYIMTAAKYVLPVLITGFLTRRLGTERYGVLSYVRQVMVYFVTFFDFGFNLSATKEISLHKDDREFVQTVYSQVMTGRALLVGIGVAAIVVLSACIGTLRENLPLVVLFYLARAANIFLPDFIFRGMEEMKFVTARYILGSLISTACILAFVTSADRMLLVPIFYLVGTAFAAVYGIIGVKKQYGLRFMFSAVKQCLSRLKESGIFFVSMAASMALSAIITFAMGLADFPDADLAYWSVAIQIVTAILALYDPITASMFPHVAQNRDYRFVLKMTAILSGAVLLGCGAAYLLADLGVRIIAGEGFETAATIFRLLLISLFFDFPAQMLGFPLLGAMGDVKYVTVSTVLSAAVVLLGTVILYAAGTLSLFSIALLKDAASFTLFASRFIFTMYRIRTSYSKEKAS